MQVYEVNCVETDFHEFPDQSISLYCIKNNYVCKTCLKELKHDLGTNLFSQNKFIRNQLSDIIKTLKYGDLAPGTKERTGLIETQELLLDLRNDIYKDFMSMIPVIKKYSKLLLHDIKCKNHYFL